MATPVSSSVTNWPQLLTSVHVWQLHVSDLRSPVVRNRCLSLLPPDERRQHDQYVGDEARDNYLARRALCRATLSKYAGTEPPEWRFGAGPFGKPAIVEPDGFMSLRFNVSHAGNLVICAVSRAGEVGIDVEHTLRPIDGALVARHFLAPVEAALVESLPPFQRKERLLEHWVLKEAFAKATGDGLGNAPERLTVFQPENARRFWFAGYEFALHRPTPEHIAAAAVRTRDPDLISFHWNGNFNRNLN